jgi:16S rRNA processing protein RimM
VNDPEAAKTLRGAKLALPRSALPKVESGQIYVADLLNLAVLDPEGKILGQVHRIQEVGESDILWIQNSEGQETPVPYEKDFIAGTNLQTRQLQLTELALDLFQMNSS